MRQDRRFNRISGTKAPLNSEKIERERERERGFRERKREVLERERICRFDSHARTPLCLNILALFYSLYPSVYFVIINVFVLFCVFFLFTIVFLIDSVGELLVSFTQIQSMTSQAVLMSRHVAFDL